MIWIRFFQILSIIFLIFSWTYPAIYYAQLPETIPVHFDFKGNADGFGTRNTVWLLSALSTAIFFLFYYVSRNPDSPLLSIPDSLRKNKPLTKLFVNVLLALSMLLFATGSYEIVQVGMGNIQEITNSGLIIIIFTFAVIIGFIIYAHIKEKKSAEST